MLFQRIKRTDPEKVFVVVMNSYSTASLTNGQVVSWDHQTDADGVGVTLASAGTGVACAGVAAQTIAAGAYGLVQAYGYHSAVRVRTLTGNIPSGGAVPGLPLCMSAAIFGFESMATGSTSVLKFPAAFALGTNASFTTKAIAAFVKAL